MSELTPEESKELEEFAAAVRESVRVFYKQFIEQAYKLAYGPKTFNMLWSIDETDLGAIELAKALHRRFDLEEYHREDPLPENVLLEVSLNTTFRDELHTISRLICRYDNSTGVPKVVAEVARTKETTPFFPDDCELCTSFRSALRQRALEGHAFAE